MVGVVGDETARDPVAGERRAVIVGEACGAVGGGDVAEARAVEAQCVDERLAHDHLAAREPFVVPDPAVGAGEVEVQRRALSEVGKQLAAVEFGDGARGVVDRDDHGPGQVLVATGSVDAEALESAPNLRTCLAVLGREPEPERAVGVAEPEPLDGHRVVDPAAGQVGQGLGGLGERRVVVGDDLGEGLGVVALGGDRGGEVAHGADPDHLARCDDGDRVGAQQLDGVAERDPLGLHHPVDHRATGLTSPHAVPQALRGRDHQRGGAVVVERAGAHQVLAGLLERHPRPDDQGDQVDLFFQPLDDLVGDAGHGLPPSEKKFDGD